MKQESIQVGMGTPYPLKGQLVLPEGNGPFPAVVLVHGSGSTNMDEKVGKLTPFQDLALGLAEHGIASVRYDKRTFAHPLKLLKDYRNASVTVREETIEDALMALELLRQDPRIDPNTLFLVGHSMGGMLAPRIDAEGGNCRGLVIMAGTPRNLDVVLQEQLDEQISQMPALVRKLSEKKLNQIKNQLNSIPSLSDEEARSTSLGNGVTLYYFKEMNEHPVEAYLAGMEKPVLIMQGSKDAQVKTHADFEAYRVMLEGKPNVTFRLYEGLNHCFVPAIYGKISKLKAEYNRPQRIGPEVIGDIARWIHENSLKP